MLNKIKSALRDIRNGEPGRRFLQHYERTRLKEGDRGSFWKTFGYVAAALVLIVGGLIFALTPGIPGFLLWIPGLGLLAARSKRLAMVLDRIEVWARKMWKRLSNSTR